MQAKLVYKTPYDNKDQEQEVELDVKRSPAFQNTQDVDMEVRELATSRKVFRVSLLADRMGVSTTCGRSLCTWGGLCGMLPSEPSQATNSLQASTPHFYVPQGALPCMCWQLSWCLLLSPHVYTQYTQQSLARVVPPCIAFPGPAGCWQPAGEGRCGWGAALPGGGLGEHHPRAALHQQGEGVR
jgi:hypothetical protein